MTCITWRSILNDSGRIIANSFNFIALLLLGTFPGWRKEVNSEGENLEVKPLPSRSISHMVLICTALATCVHLVATMWQHVGAVSSTAVLRAVLGVALEARPGTASIALSWVACGLSGVVSIQLIVIIPTIKILHPLPEK